MVSRRTFIKMGAAGPTLWLAAHSGLPARALAAFGTSTTPLLPATIDKFVSPLLIPPVMPQADKVGFKGSHEVDYYEILVRQFQQQILPDTLPATMVWGYGPNPRAVKDEAVFNSPSLTIEARANRPVRIKWINRLVDHHGDFLPHLLPVDQTLHWANPPGGEAGRDGHQHHPDPNPYTGPVPIVTHLHGAVGVGDESDGYAEAWYLPRTESIPTGFASEGTWYDFFKAKASRKFGARWEPGSATFQYPNDNRASTLWYHDHVLGMTRLNVYAGLAGFYLVRGGPTDRVVDTRSNRQGVLPGPAPGYDDRPGTVYYEIPLAIQDRSFNVDGSLFYPDSRVFFDQYPGPYAPASDVPPIWNPEFFGDCMMVNGRTWPTHTVEARRYRFRLLNGCNSRFLILDFSAIPGAEVWQIGNEGGFLPAPVDISQVNGGRILLAPAERADIIVDFTLVAPGKYILKNVGPDAPFNGTVDPAEVADPNTTGQVMQFEVTPAYRTDRSTPPRFLALPRIKPLSDQISTTRPLALLEQMSSTADVPVAAMLGTLAGDPNTTPATWLAVPWSDPVTENPGTGNTEVWEFYNATVDAHPIHVHETVFEVLNRQGIVVADNGTVQVAGTPPLPPDPWETGFKDTVIAYPGQVTRIRAQFTQRGQYVWHCHIVEHEDNEMMRPYRIGPVQPGQPDQPGGGGHVGHDSHHDGHRYRIRGHKGRYKPRKR